MEGVGHSTLLKFFHDNIPSNTMSERSPTIQSEVPRLQQLRSITETTLANPEHITDDIKYRHNIRDARIPATEETGKDYTVDDKKDVTLPEEEKDQNGDFAKLPNTSEKFTDEKVSSAANLASDDNTVADKDDFVYSPVITVTKEESTLTKGDLKLQKVVVSEDIADKSMINNMTTSVTEASSPNEVHTEIHSDVLPVLIRTDPHPHTNENNDKQKTKVEDQKDLKKNQTKIPKLRFKQAVERIRKEKQDKGNSKDPKPSLEQKRRSSIPKLKDIIKNSAHSPQKDFIETKKGQELESPKVDDEFDKIYEEIIESEASNNIPSPEKISNPVKLESKFEEIIHAYDENNIEPISIEKAKSKIPLFKRKSEQEIEIPTPNHRKYSFKRSNTEDHKNKAPVAITKEKSMKPDVETVRHGNRSETTPSVKSGAISKNKTDSLGNANPTIVKSEAIQKSIEMKKELMTSLTKTVVKSENISDSNVNDATKCKIPVALNTKDSLDTKINSATLNKHPTRLNIKDRMSQTVTDKKDKIMDKNFEKAHLQNALHFKAPTLLEEEKFDKQDVKRILGTKNIDDEVIAEKPTSLSQESETSEIQNMDLEEQNGIKTKHSYMPTIPNSLTKYGRVTKTTDKETVSSENLYSTQLGPPYAKPYAHLTTINGNKHVNEFSHLTENQNCQETEPKNSNLILESSKSKTDTLLNVKTNPSNIPHLLPSQYENESKIPTNESSHFIVKINLDDSKHDVKMIKEYQTVKELTAANIGAQEFKIETENNKAQDKDSNFKTDPKTDVKINYVSKEITIDSEKDQSVNKIELTLKSPIRTIMNENDTDKESNTNTQNITTLRITQEINDLKLKQQLDQKLKRPYSTSDVRNMQLTKPLISKTKISDNEAALVTDENQADLVNKKVLANTQNNLKKENDNEMEDLLVQRTNIGEEAEEDIIMLKGKVNRVIKRLDSKDYKTVKKEVDDVPKEVSVIAKIAMFERCETKDALSKSNESIESLQEDNDKPKIVNEILKTDINQNELNYIDESANATALENKVNNEKTRMNNDLEGNKVNKSEKTSHLKTKNISSEGKMINRTISSVNNEVFEKDGKSSTEVWQEYRRKKEDSDMRRARSLAELDLGDAVKGRVKQLVVRMSSVDRGEGRREQLEGRYRPRGGAVSQRIAMYERKLTPTRGDAPPVRQPAKPLATEAKTINEEELRGRIEELKSAKVKYGRSEDVAYIELNDGGKMPVLALGTAMLEPALLKHVIHAGIELGYRAIDCAYIYGNEREVGQAIRDKIHDGSVTRSELFIINKLWSTFHRRDLVEKACRQSLDAMGLDYFDLYLIHNPMSFKEGSNPLPKIAGVLQYSSHDYLEAWYGVEGLISRGLARRGGLSNFNSQQVERIVEKARIKPVINQVECHPYLTQLRLEEFCLSRNIKLSCFGVLGSKGTPAELTSGLAPAIDDPLLQVMAAGLGVTPAQLLISYQLQLGRSVVVKCSSAAHLAQALAVAPPSSSASPSPALVRLQASHVAALNALNRNKRIFDFKGMGDTHRNYPFRIPF
ncbi:MATH and LRR domain-containing protein PFE0570w-like [Maniola jurtina]|uniref:MATH and LRR domain-containing protein PFE0570w-like n=1 Tax=Maniola jurtina TaxID=191418 RepID=UPI001E68ECF3|nr:MATH and LRR domain-containing protein PFE0570w-like [Maniola jurtina]XP_045781654.1 MATH and LRR domain-containing protein PFE0570w-like [Maniola jurtina]